MLIWLTLLNQTNLTTLNEILLISLFYFIYFIQCFLIKVQKFGYLTLKVDLYVKLIRQLAQYYLCLHYL